MTKVISIFCCLLLTLLCSVSAQSKDQLVTQEGLSMYSKILKQEVKYSVCLPSNYYSDKASLPVVYMLHGLGDNASSWLEYGKVDSFTKKRVDEGQIMPMIYIMPEGYTNYYVNDSARKFLYQDMFINELIPYVDKTYRTIADKKHRALVGYSMGGFGALMLAINNTEVFGVTIPLSISVRTDEQYMKEETTGWNEQWGRLFGGVGKQGVKRLTNYYKENSPFHVLKNKQIDTKIFILNGDDEGTLARSNEELHMLMRDKNIPHEFRVRNGGHEFLFWFDALTDGLNFISDYFSGKPYRGDELKSTAIADISLTTANYKGEQIQIYLPEDYNVSSRKYPVVYVDTQLKDDEKNKFAGSVHQLIADQKVAPQILVFYNSRKLSGNIKPFIEHLESTYRIREGRRFRAYLSYKQDGKELLENTKNQYFTCVASFEASASSSEKLLSEWEAVNKKEIERTWIYIDASDKGEIYRENGMLHLLLKDKDVYHEYRVREGNGVIDYLLPGIEDAFIFISEKFHK